MSFRTSTTAFLHFATNTAAHAGPTEDRLLLEQEVTGLFDRFRKPLLRYISSFGLPHPDAEEIIQEVFLALFQHLDRGKSRHNLPSWIFRVTHNLALRRRTKMRRSHGLTANSSVEAIAIDPELNPEDSFMRNQTQQRLRAVVDALPEPDRQCIFLRAEGLRYREIARILNISLGAVALCLARSLARVSRCAERLG